MCDGRSLDPIVHDHVVDLGESTKMVQSHTSHVKYGSLSWVSLVNLTSFYYAQRSRPKESTRPSTHSDLIHRTYLAAITTHPVICVITPS